MRLWPEICAIIVEIVHKNVHILAQIYYLYAESVEIYNINPENGWDFSNQLDAYKVLVHKSEISHLHLIMLLL